MGSFGIEWSVVWYSSVNTAVSLRCAIQKGTFYFSCVGLQGQGKEKVWKHQKEKKASNLKYYFCTETQNSGITQDPIRLSDAF